MCTGKPRLTSSTNCKHRVYPRVYGGTGLDGDGVDGDGVYPRVYGGTAHELSYQENQTGLSPRVRGNRDPLERGKNQPGSIPACTGEPRSGPRSA